MSERLWTGILSCHDCGHELNRAENVPESKKHIVSMRSPLVAFKCPNGCRSTFSDMNMNTNLKWTPVDNSRYQRSKD